MIGVSPPHLRARLQENPYAGYAYAYPHKTAYRHFESPIPLDGLWAAEDRSNLFLYVHLPFCEMRCGFCNLFTTPNPEGSLVSRYLEALDRQLAVTGEALGDFRFARAAFGGGTPSYLDVEELEGLFGMINKRLGGITGGIPVSFEWSPATVTREKLDLLREKGITRVSLGVQSFIREETKTLGRPQHPDEVHRALGEMRSAGFPVMNIDLIYGAANQTRASWLSSIEQALEYEPEELYLYPLYVRPLTGLDRIGRSAHDGRLALYRAGRDRLKESGYRQISMRLFRKSNLPDDRGPDEGPLYCCQEDGMVGFGAGARSYTREVHYCTEYAVGRSGVREIIDDYIGRSMEEQGQAVFGCRLNAEEQRRRFLIKSILRSSGLDLRQYTEQFGADALIDFPEIGELVEAGLARGEMDRIRLTAAGLELSDAVGPYLYSPAMTRKMERCDLS